MLEFFKNYGADLTAFLIALAGAITAVYTLVKTFKVGKKNAQDVQITREGIVEAFKSAKLPTEWKVSVSNKVADILNAGLDRVLALVNTKIDALQQTNALVLKVLQYTAAANKLTEEERAKVEEVIQLINEDQKTIDITEE